MKKNLVVMASLSLGLCFSACRSLNNTVDGSAAVTKSGGGVSASSGVLIGKDGKSTVIGAAPGMAVNLEAKAAVGGQMDKAAAEVAVIDGTKVDSFTDANGLKALRVTFDAETLFDTGKTALSEEAEKALVGFAGVLKANPMINIMIFGHTDNVGTLEDNRKVSSEHAEAVARFLRAQAVPASQIKEVGGRGFADPVASNATAEGQAQNRRVEIYMYAGEEMIKSVNS